MFFVHLWIRAYVQWAIIVVCSVNDSIFLQNERVRLYECRSSYYHHVNGQMMLNRLIYDHFITTPVEPIVGSSLFNILLQTVEITYLSSSPKDCILQSATPLLVQ